tara:strand:+ start:68 stop:454 length:387 start_codon:yes stop_codon:yes gene_type:complete
MADNSGTITASTGTLNIPSGSGSERLRRVTVHDLNDGWQNDVISGVAGHIYTIISIIFAARVNTAGNIEIRVNNGTHNVSIVGSEAVGGYGTFVFNDKFVLEEDDDLDVYNEHTNGDWWVSYIDQDWT